MKKTVSKLLFSLLAIVMMVGMRSTVAYAEGEVIVNYVSMEVGKYLPSGTDTTEANLTTTQPASGGYAYMEDANTLVLDNYVGQSVSVSSDTTIKLRGESSIEYLAGGGNVIIQDDDSDAETGKLSITVSVYFGGELTIKDCIWDSTTEVKCEGVTINHSKVAINANFNGINAVQNGQVQIINGSNVDITATEYGIKLSGSGNLTVTDSTLSVYSTSTTDHTALNKKPDITGFTEDVLILLGNKPDTVSFFSTLADDIWSTCKYIKILPKTGNYPVNVKVNNVYMEVGKYLPSGVDKTSADLTTIQPTGGYAYMEDATTVVLNNYQGNSVDFGVDLTIKLSGNSKVNRVYAVATNPVTIQSATAEAGELAIYTTCEVNDFTIKNSTLAINCQVDCYLLNIDNSTVTVSATGYKPNGLNHVQNVQITNGSIVDITATGKCIDFTGEAHNLTVTDSTLSMYTTATTGNKAMDRKPIVSGFTGGAAVLAGAKEVSAEAVDLGSIDIDSWRAFNYVKIMPQSEFTQAHIITVESGDATNNMGSVITQSVYDKIITITAHAPSDDSEMFDKWVVVSGGVELEDETSVSTTFRMLTKDVTVKATYKSKHTHSGVLVPQVPATAETIGTEEHYKCSGCDKLFTDATCTTEIAAADLVIEKLPPALVSGNNGNFAKGSTTGLAFKSSAALEDLISVSVNSTVLDESKYSKASGSTLITLKPDYLETLSVGGYTLTITSSTGSVDATFTIANAPAVTPGVITPATSGDGAPTAVASQTVSPKTGDASNLLLWMAMVFVAGLALAGMVAYNKRKGFMNK